MEFYCEHCNAKLTRSPIHAADPKTLSSVDGDEALPDDESYVSPEDFVFIFNSNLTVTHIVSTKCLRLVNHRDDSRFRGCCGPSVMDQYNQVCFQCRREIGVIYGDCCAPHFVAINANRLCTEPKW